MEGSCPRGPNIFLRWVKIHLPRGFNTFLAEVVRLHLPLFFIQPYCSKNLLVRLSETFFTSSDTYHCFMCERMLEVFFWYLGGMWVYTWYLILCIWYLAYIFGMCIWYLSVYIFLFGGVYFVFGSVYLFFRMYRVPQKKLAFAELSFYKYCC